MRGVLRIRTAATAIVLAAAWCGLWGEVTVGNAVAGALLGLAIGAVTSVGRPVRRVRLLPLLRFAGVVAADLVRSTVQVAYEIITPVDSTDESVIAVRLPPTQREHMLMLVVSVTLTPGTAVVDIDVESGTLYVHLLHDHRRADTIGHVLQLAALAREALPFQPGKELQR